MPPGIRKVIGGHSLSQTMGARRFVLAAILLLVAMPLYAPTVAALTYSDTFADDTIGTAPTASWYTFSTTGSQTTLVLNYGGYWGNALRHMTAAGTGDSFAFAAAGGWDMCDGGFDMAMHFTSLPAAGQREVFSTDGVKFAGFQVTSGGIVQAYSDGTVASIAGATLTLKANVWYNFTVNILCTSAQVTVVVNNTFAVTADAAGSLTALDEITLGEGSTTDGGSFWFDNFGVSFSPPPIAPTNSIAVTTLSAFDIDRTGEVIITRQALANDVVTYSGLSLVQLGAVDSDCGSVDGAFSQTTSSGTLVAYVDCDGLGDPTALNIASPTLGQPTCGGCDASIELGGFSVAGGDELGELGEMAGFDISFSKQYTAPGELTSSRPVAWAFVSLGPTTAGTFGVDVFTENSAGADGRHSEQISVGGQSLDDMCAWQVRDEVGDSSGLQDGNYIAIVDESVPVRVYQVDFFNFFSGGNFEEVRASLVLNRTFPVGAQGVGCADNHLLISENNGANDHIFYLDLNTGVTPWIHGPSGLTAGERRSAALSRDGLWFAYQNGDVVEFGHANNGTIRCSLDITGIGLPLVGLEIHPTGQSVWAAGSSEINRFAVQANGCSTVGIVGDTGGLPGGSNPNATAPAAGVIGNLGPQLGSAIGIGGFGGSLIGGVIVMGMFAYGLWEEGSRQRIWAIIGAVLGFLLAWALGLFGVGTVFTLIVLGAGLWYMKQRSGA